jgi:hypothetical protein
MRSCNSRLDNVPSFRLDTPARPGAPHPAWLRVPLSRRRCARLDAVDVRRSHAVADPRLVPALYATTPWLGWLLRNERARERHACRCETEEEEAGAPGPPARQIQGDQKEWEVGARKAGVGDGQSDMRLVHRDMYILPSLRHKSLNALP